jgi:hypothetical protein
MRPTALLITYECPNSGNTIVHGPDSRGRRVDQPNHARERVAADLVDVGEEDAHGVATYEVFDCS